MKLLKKFISVCLSLVLVLVLIPTALVHADEVFWVVKYDNNTGVLYAESTDTQPSGTYYASEEEAVAAYQSGAQATITYGGQTTYYANPYPAFLDVNNYTGSVKADDLVMKLFADCNYETYDASFTISVPMTLDLNGHVMAFGQYGKKGYTYRFQKDFVLKDTSVGETGVLYGINNTAAILLGTSSAGNTFTLESGTIKSETAIFDTYSNCTINVTGGHMVSYSKYGVGDSRGIFAELSSGCALNISGGEFRSDQSAKSWDTMSFDPMGYPTKNVNANSTISVTGGTFSGQAIQKYVPGYTADQSFTNENPTITVGDYNITRTTVSSPYGAAAYDVYIYTVAPVPVNYVAQIGETQYESFDEAVAAAQAGDTIVLLDDITFGTDRSVPVWGNAGEQPFNIDLNGHTFQTDSEVSIDAGNNGYKASAFCFAFDNEANITVSGGDIKTAFGAGVYVSGENVNLTLEDVDIAQNYPQNVQTTNEYSSAVRITYEGSVEINGGTYGGKNSIAVSNSGGKVVINDGTFYNDIYFSNYTSKSYYDNSRDAVKSITINGGTFLGNFVNPDKGNLVIKGGSFTSDPTAYVAKGYKVTEASGVYTVSAVNYVAQIGETQHETLADAINVANADTSSNAITIKLLADLDFSDDEYKAYKWSGSNVNPLAITRSNVTLDLNGKTISNMGNCALGVGSIYAKDGTITNVTIKNGTLLAGKTDNVTNSYVLLIGGTNNCLIDSVTTLGGVNNCNNSNVVIKDSTIRGTKYYTVCAQTGANVTIRGTSYTKNTDQTVQTKAMFWVQGAGTDEDLITSSNPTGAFNASIITIESGYFNVDSNGAFYLGGGLAPTLTGGYYNIDPAAYVADGYAVESVSEEYEGVTYTYHVTTKKVAQIGNVQYETLAAAIEAAADNTQTTIVMIADEDIEGNTGVTVPSTKNIVLDLNGHTIQNLVNENKASQVITNKGTLTVTDNSANGDGVIRNNVADGTVAGNWYSTPQANYVTNVITNYGTLVIEGGTIQQTSNGYIAFAVDNVTNANLHTPTTTINGGTLKSEMTTVRLFCNSTTNLNSVTMTGGTVESKRHAFYLQNPSAKTNMGLLTIGGGNVSSTLNYLQIDAGADSSKLDASITGGNFVGALSVDGTYKEFISGGKFAVEPNSDYIVEGYAALTNTDEDSATYPYIVGEEVTYVAQIGDVQYETLAAAINAANQVENGVKTTIELINDEAFDYTTGGMTINAGKVVEIDLNGHQVVGTANSGTTSAFINNYGSLTILDSTDVDEDGADCGRLAAGANPSWVWDGSDSYSGSYASNLINNLGTVVVKSGLLQNLSSGSAAYVVDNNSTSYDVSLTVTGGKLLAAKSSVRQFANSKTHTNALTVTGGTIQGGRFGVVVHEYGQLAMNLSGGTITTTDTDNYAVNVWTTSSTDTQYANINVSGDVVIDGYLYLTDLGRKSSTGTPATVSISGGYIEGLVFYGNTDGLEGSVTGGHYALNSVTDEEVTYLLSEQCIADGYEVAENQGADAEEYPYIVQEAVTYVAQIGNVKYETLAAAVAAANNSDTIVLINNATESNYFFVQKNITIDLNGYTASFTGAYGIIVHNGQLTIDDSGVDGKLTCSGSRTIQVQGATGELTVNGGTIENTKQAGLAVNISNTGKSVVINDGSIIAGTNGYGVQANGTSTITINGGTITSGGWGVTSFDTATITVNDGTITATKYSISANGSSGNNATIIINGGYIGNEENDAGIYVPSGSLTVIDGEIVGENGIYFKSTNLDIRGGIVRGVGNYQEYSYNANGSNPTGDALVIDSCGYPNGIDNVSISGGYFVSANASPVKVYIYQENEPVEKFITGGTYANDSPDEEYIADGYAAVVSNNTDYVVGRIEVTANTSVEDLEEAANENEIYYSVTTDVVDSEDQSMQTLQYTQIRVTGSDENTYQNTTVSADTTPAGAINVTNIKDTDTLAQIVSDAVAAAGENAADITSMTLVLVSDNPAVDTTLETPKITYEVHPEMITYNSTGEVLSEIVVANEQLSKSFTIKLFVPNEIRNQYGQVNVVHTLQNNETVEYLNIPYDSDGYVTIDDVTEFSEFALTPVLVESTGNADIYLTLDLNASTDILLYINNLAENTAAYNYKVVSTYHDMSNNLVTNTVRLSQVTPVNGWYILSVASLTAPQLNDQVTIDFYYNDELINTYTYSVADYCNYQINNSSDQGLVEVCKALYDYGYAAQLLFNYNYQVNYGYEPYHNITSMQIGDSYNVNSVSNYSDVFISYTKSVALNSTNAIYLYFKPYHSIEDYSFTYNDQALNVSEAGGGYYYVKVDGIAAKNLNNTVVIKSYYNGTATEEFHYSVLTYAYNKQNSTSTPYLDMVCRALYQYWKYANTYFK